MKRRFKVRIWASAGLCLACSMLLIGTVTADDNAEIAAEVMQEYLEFAEPAAGVITPEQIRSVGVDKFAFIDTRTRAQYDVLHIKGASHIDWRQILDNKDQVPSDRPVILYCNTGLRSARAHFALSVLGYDNLKIMAGGYDNWKKANTP